jgi:hypothetical protein
VSKQDTNLKARQAALARDVAQLMHERGAAETMTPGQAIATGLITLGELDLLAQQYGVQIGAAGRITWREDATN